MQTTFFAISFDRVCVCVLFAVCFVLGVFNKGVESNINSDRFSVLWSQIVSFLQLQIGRTVDFDQYLYFSFC